LARHFDPEIVRIFLSVAERAWQVMRREVSRQGPECALRAGELTGLSPFNLQGAFEWGSNAQLGPLD
jgi:hypothetical protein